ncbi:MAG: MBL fold metallo-hydrolase [Pyrinomonadaceae bacterium]
MHKELEPAVPVDAAALVVLEPGSNRVLWARRNPALAFLGGFHSFPGGKFDAADSDADVRNSFDREHDRLIACAVREAFEEVGLLMVRNGSRLTSGQRRSLHDDLISGRSSFAEILEHWGLWIDAADFSYAGSWITPEFSPRRFDTRFYVCTAPKNQTPYSAIDELVDVEYIDAQLALAHWRESRVLIAPPVHAALKALNEILESEPEDPNPRLAENYKRRSEKAAAGPHYFALNDRSVCIPLRTKTLPPATHTNCFIIGNKDFIVIDPASTEPIEQARLEALLERRMRLGANPKAIVVSHLHPDHFGGEQALKRYFKERFDLDVPILAHKETIDALNGKTEIDGEIGRDFVLKDEAGEEFVLENLHLPGHAKGLLCFYDRQRGFLFSTDNVVGIGSVVIAPPEGNMSDYLESLRKMEELPGLRSLCGSHGPAIGDARQKIRQYIEHRLEREQQVLSAFETGFNDSNSIAEFIYKDLSEALMPLARLSVEAHLERLEKDRRISR